MPINAHPEYLSAEKEYILAQTLEERITKLKVMISYAPAHKGGENLRAQLKTRLKKLNSQLAKAKKSGKSSFRGIKKDDNQVLIIGKTNSGKSSLLSTLTNARPKISENNFTTTRPIVGMFTYETVPIQLIENPGADSEFFDKSIPHSADTLILLINSLKELPELQKKIEKTKAKKIIVFHKTDILTENQKRKISATLKSKKQNFILFSSKTKENIEELKDKIFQSFDKIRVYTKEPEKKERSKKPIIMKPNSTVKDVAEKILKGFSQRVKQTKIWGPSSKFSGQGVGLKHKLKDLDVVEFKTR